MKYAIIIPDGCADEPQESLSGQTPLQAAHIPAMDDAARHGILGRSDNIPRHLPAGSAVANMSLLGYDPETHFTGRAPLEAAAQGIELGADDWAIRCNLVTIQDQIMRDFTADHISSEEARQLLSDLQRDCQDGPWEFQAGISYRNLLLYRGQDRPAPFSHETRATPPHDLTDQSVVDDFPRGPGSDWLNDLMSQSMQRFRDHPVNQQRLAAGKLPATNVWLWGLGKRPSLTAFADRFELQGKMITAVDLLRGLASLIGWQRVEVPGATGYLDTDYAAKGRYAVDAIQDTDIVCVHIEATDEASHEGDTAAKIKALQEIDQHIVRPVLDELRRQGEFRLLISPDHPTPVRTKTHSYGTVPWVIVGSDIHPDPHTTYDELSAEKSELCFDNGCELMPFFLGRDSK